MSVIKKIKLITSTFNKEEKSGFRKFLISQSRSEATSDIYDFIAKNIGEEDKVLKVKLLEKHSKRNYHYVTNSIIISLEQYLVLNNFKHKSADFNIRLLEEYNNRGLVDVFDTQTKKVEKILSDNNKLLGKIGYLYSYLTSEIQISIPHFRNKKYLIPLRNDSGLKYLYIVARLESFIEFFTNNSILQKDVCYQEITQFIEANRTFIAESNLASIYSRLIDNLRKDELDIVYYSSLLENNNIQGDIKYRIFSVVLTYTIISSDRLEGVLYNFICVFLHTQGGNIFFNGKVDSIYFFVVFKYVLHFEGYIAAKRFIETNKTGLYETMRDRIIRFCELIIFHKNGLYSEVIKHIHITKFTHPYLNIMYRITKIKISFDMELRVLADYYTLDNDVKNTKKYIIDNRNNVNSNIFISVNNFIAFYEIIMGGILHGKKDLQRRIDYEETIEKEWLLSRLEKL